MALIVCIEDVEDFREVITYELEKAGHKVIECTNGNEGLEVIHKEEPDLIISDVMMPNMSGLELLIKLRSSEGTASNTPIIIMSASTHQHYEEEALKYGAFEYLLKPINWDNFLFSVRRALDSRVVT
ncbi:MAG: response regulator [Methyloligellaceae bacterium]